MGRWRAYRQHLWRSDRGSPRSGKLALAALPLLVVIALAIGLSERTSRPANPATSAAPAGAASAAAQVVGVNERQARRWIAEHAADADNVAAILADVRLAMAELRRSATQANINQLGSIALTASGALGRSDGFGRGGGGGLGSAETQVALGDRQLGQALRAAVAYMDDPGRASFAAMTTRYLRGVAEWNGAVETIWRVARRAGPPTV